MPMETGSIIPSRNDGPVLHAFRPLYNPLHPLRIRRFTRFGWARLKLAVPADRNCHLPPVSFCEHFNNECRVSFLSENAKISKRKFRQAAGGVAVD